MKNNLFSYDRLLPVCQQCQCVLTMSSTK